MGGDRPSGFVDRPKPWGGRLKLRRILLAYLKYAYIRLPVSEWARYRLKSALFRVLTPWLRQSASYLFWSEQRRLSRQNPEPGRAPAGAERGQGERGDGDQRPGLLLIDSCTPTPDRDSGSMDVFNSIRIFLALGFRVSFIPESNLLDLGPYTRALEDLGVECLHAPRISSVKSWLQAWGATYDAVMLFRAPVAIRHLSHVRRYCPQARVIFSTIDLHFLRESRQSGTTPEPTTAWNPLHRAELDCIQRADKTIVISEAERRWLEAAIPGLQLALVPLVRELPASREVAFEDRAGMAFIGNFQHPPNVDAVRYFLEEIWPEIHRQLPEVVFYIVGSYLPGSLNIQANEDVVALGYVEDLDAIFGSIRLTVAPLRFGAGLKGKVVTSLGYGVPAVVSSIAAEGMGLVDGEEVLVADGVEAFRDQVLNAYRDQRLWERLAREGRAAAQRLYSLEVSRQAYREIFSELKLPGLADGAESGPTGQRAN